MAAVGLLKLQSNIWDCIRYLADTLLYAHYITSKYSSTLSNITFLFYIILKTH